MPADYTQCIACGGSDLREYAELHPRWGNSQVAAFRCGECGMRRLKELPDPNETRETYTDQYAEFPRRNPVV